MKKNLIIIHAIDGGACTWVRLNFAAMMLMTTHGEGLEVVMARSPIHDRATLSRTLAVIMSRPLMRGRDDDMVMHYKVLKSQYDYKIFADFDDLVFDIDGVDSMPAYNKQPFDTRVVGKFLDGIIGLFDGITVSTDFLKCCFESRFNFHNVKVVPNGVPRFCFGYDGVNRKVGRKIKKPIVLYAGSCCHYKDGMLGDFDGGWVPWLVRACKKDKIELHMFDVPWFLEEVKDKIHLHEYVSALEFPSVVASIHPDIYLAPLASNDFNRSKSNLKLLEASALGAAFLGSDFWMSPYENAHPYSRIQWSCDADDIEGRVKWICKHMDDVLKYQKNFMDSNNLWLDSEEYLATFLRAYLGDSLKIIREGK